MALFTELVWFSILLVFPVLALFKDSAWFSVLSVFPLLLFLTLKKNSTKNKGLLPPGPPKYPIVGNAHLLGAVPQENLWKLAQKYGPVMLLRLGRFPTVVVSSAEAAREVMKTHDAEFCSRPLLAGVRKLSYNFLDIAFSPYSDNWRVMRKVAVSEMFSLKRVQSFNPLRQEEIDLMIGSIAEESASSAGGSGGKPVNITDHIFALLAHITFRMSFGFNYRGTGFDSDRFHEVVHDVAEVVAVISAEELFPYFGWIIDRVSGHQARLERTFRELDKFFQHVVDYHLNPDRKKEHEDMIDVLLGMENQKEMHGLKSFTQDNVKGVLLNLFLGGIDTSANTLNWAMGELGRNQRVRKKLQDEVRSCVGKKGKVTPEDLDKLHYMRLVIKETMRLYPPVPLLVTRETMYQSKIGDYDISPGTLVQVNAWGIARDPKYWKDPELFIPERFIDSSVDFRGQHFEFVPFGSGRRVCPGINMAMATVELALANLLYCFDWKLPAGVKPEDVSMEAKDSGLTVALVRKEPVNLVPTRYIP